MFKRWFIRGFFIGLLLLCVGGWVGSYVQASSVDRWWPSTDGYLVNWQVGLARGQIHIFYSHMSGGDEVSDWRLEKRLLGFSVQADHAPTGLAVLDAYIPFWFPSILCGIALLLAWRQTRKPKPGGGFPVELTAKKVQE